MEVGAVKQAFNNEVILLKKKLNQAKIQIIHKLTRKAKQLTEKKAPEQLQEKLKRKAESAVKEVLIIKKIKAKDIAKFIVTHKGELNTFLNKPQVDNDKACARLLLHKALQDKYKFIRGRFSNVPIKDLFMSRLERRKIKKEEKEKQKEKQKNKKKAKDNKVVNSEGDWNVEDVGVDGNGEGNGKLSDDDDKALSDDDEMSGDDASDDDGESGDEGESGGNAASDDESEQADEVEASGDEEILEPQNDESANEDSDSGKEDDVIVKPSPKVKAAITEVKVKEPESKKIELPKEINKVIPPKKVVKKNPEKKLKELNKSTKFNEKIHQKKLKNEDGPAAQNKIVDPFFITSTGENYMSVVEPRAPDEIKDEHMQGNRRLRRAVMFGHVPKSKLRQNNSYKEDRFNKQNKFDRPNNFKSNFNDKPQFNDRKSFNNDFNNKRGFNNRNDSQNNVEAKPEKLHPSWEAKKKKSGILPFEGKKIVFDDS
ncbi:unnamed protein product [Chrysodeixis includens]|uniref:Serum response factor-binding protein 1 n=1 Tax=Chrysodeixis includens TaxID=689277 RepID=A0A9P0FT80_CHRIL|nr:unnamed protein product [Chrysodeixis includens]